MCNFLSGKLLFETWIGWSKFKAVSTDGTRIGVRILYKVVTFIKQVAPEVVSIHCMIHCEALVAKKFVNEEKTAHFPIPFILVEHGFYDKNQEVEDRFKVKTSFTNYYFLETKNEKSEIEG